MGRNELPGSLFFIFTFIKSPGGRVLPVIVPESSLFMGNGGGKLSVLLNKSKINYEKKIYLNTFFVLTGN